MDGELDYKESWALKNWWFWTVVLEKILESPLDCKEIQPVHPKGNHCEYSLEGLMLNLKLQYFGHIVGRDNSLEKTLMLWKIKGRSRGGWQRIRWLNRLPNSMQMSLSKLQCFWRPQNNVCHCVHCFCIYGPWSYETEFHDLSFLNVEL